MKTLQVNLHNRTSDAYRFTVCLKSRKGFDELDELKAEVRELNKKLKAQGSKHLKRVCVKARLGYNNPNAHLYRGQYCYTVKMEHGQHADVYVYDRYIG